ncbi:MAG: TatD family hydrolase [Halolamina sp.]
MDELDTPVLDNHLHLDPEHARGMDAVRDFAHLGGTHLLVVNKPSWHLGPVPSDPDEFHRAFQATLDAVADATELLPGRAWAVLGVHPGLVSQLVDDGHSPEEAAELMRAGLDIAAEYVTDGGRTSPPSEGADGGRTSPPSEGAGGRALALKTGRPHYEVSDAVWDASNAVLKHGLALGAEHDCAVQLHTEGADHLTEIAEWAEARGLPSERVVKHYAGGTLVGPTPSVMSEKARLERAVEADEPFLMETDYVDDPDRPGAVLGPKTVPRRVRWLLAEGHDDAVHRAHVETPRLVYGIDTVSTLDSTE